MSSPLLDRAVSRVPPLPAILAAALAAISAFAPGAFFVVVLGFSGGQISGRESLLLLLPSLAFCLGLLVGAVLLLRGRSWLVVAVAGGALGTLLVGGALLDGWGDYSWGFWLPVGLLPVLTAALASLPRVRAWVDARRASA